MFWLRFLLLVVVCSGLGFNSHADDDLCAKYQVKPDVKIEFYDWKKSVKQDYLESDSLHGVTEAALKKSLAVGVDGVFVKSGFCVVIKSVTYKIGFEDFVVTVDKNYEPGSCIYNAVMAHEDKHVDAHVSVLNENKENIHNVISDVANSIKPVFVKDKKEYESAYEKMSQDVLSQVERGELMRQINSEIQHRNEEVDIKEDGADIQKCIDEIWR